MKKNTFKYIMIILCLSFILTACSDNESGTDKNLSKESNTLTIAYGVELENMNLVTGPVMGNVPLNLVYEPLVKYNNGELEPCLATDWTINENGKEITLQLRENVVFHDDSPFNAEAVKKNLEYSKNNPVSIWLKGASTIESIEVLGEYEIKIVYSESYYGAMYDLSAPLVLTMMSPNMIEEGNYESMTGTIGTGPYVYKSFQDGVETVFQRNEEYWGDKGNFEKIIFKYVPEESSRLQALQSKEVDMIYGSDYITYDTFYQATNVKEVEGKVSEGTLKTRNLLLNASSSILSDLKVRQAIAYGFNPQEIVDSLMYGYEEVADQILDASLPYCDVKFEKKHSHNIKKAKSLLKEAGWIIGQNGYCEKDNQELTLNFAYTQSRSLQKEIAEAFQAQMKEIGIRVNLQPLELMAWYSEVMQGKFDVTINISYGAPFDPQNYINPMLGQSGEAVSISTLPDMQEFKNAIEKLNSTPNEKERKELYSYIFNYLNNNVIEVPISYQKELVLYNSDKIESITFGNYVGCLWPKGIVLKK